MNEKRGYRVVAIAALIALALFSCDDRTRNQVLAGRELEPGAKPAANPVYSALPRQNGAVADDVFSRHDLRVTLDSMTIEEKCAQLLMVCVEGDQAPSKGSKALLAGVPAGGVILFSFNVSSRLADTAALTGELQDGARRNGAGIPLFIAIDHEGGSVFRFGSSLTRLPPAERVGQSEKREYFAETLGKIAASELRALGITMNLAPVVEAVDASSRDFLGSRSYSGDPVLCDLASGAFVRGMNSGMLACAVKHYPGNTGVDPHRSAAVIDLSRSAIEAKFFPRFASVFRQEPAAVMLSHVALSAWDAGLPATLNRELVTDQLKGVMGFGGIVLTDDIMMKSVLGGRTPEEAAVLAVLAGADMVMVSGSNAARDIHAALIRAVAAGRIPLDRLDDAVGRILVQKFRYSLETEFDAGLRSRRLELLPGLVRENGRKLEALLRT